MKSALPSAKIKSSETVFHLDMFRVLVGIFILTFERSQESPPLLIIHLFDAVIRHYEDKGYKKTVMFAHGLESVRVTRVSSVAYKIMYILVSIYL